MTHKQERVDSNPFIGTPIIFFPVDLLSSFSYFVDCLLVPCANRCTDTQYTTPTPQTHCTQTHTLPPPLQMTNNTTQCKLQCVQDGLGSLQLVLVVFLLSSTNAKITYTRGGHHLLLALVVFIVCQLYIIIHNFI